MLEDFEEAIKQALQDKGITTDKYFGEIREPSKVKLDVKKIPLVFIDYTGYTKPTALEKKHNFSLYIVHISYSKNEKTRTEKHYELYELLETIGKVLNLKEFEGSKPIYLTKATKIADQVTDIGYLTVFKQDFNVILK